MEALIALATFVTVTLTAYGLFYRQAENDPMDSRLGGLRYVRPGKQEVPDPEAAFKARVVAPMVKALSAKANGVLPSTMSERLESAMKQAGLNMKTGQLILIVGITAGLVPLLAVLYMAAIGKTGQMLLITYGVAAGFGIYGPRVWIMGRIKRRQKEIWRALPDAFDLITASVEAGLGIDAAFSRVIEKVKGPFAEELTRTMREITMGRTRRDAFLDMADRTGVEELRSLVNSIVQAEQMGISIGSVIRVQTGVMRVKRKQKAEEAAFKAPIKMVFPLVLFIFPAILIVIGGPAIIQMKGAF
ncbi:MAG: type II secretion system F family protein [Dehalococcoidia bacterium]|nr:type II secretion system F family protein [Dehalococcoidia bacterium]